MGADRPRAAGRVAEVGHRRAAADRPRRPQRRRHLQGPHLPQVPRRPARVRGRRPADARGQDRDDRRAAQPARRARPADRRDRRAPSEDGAQRRRPARARHAHLHVRRAVAAPQLENVLDMLDGRYPIGGVRRAARRASSGTASPGTIRARKGARALAITNAGTIPDRGLFSRQPARTAAASASSTRRWSTRRGPGQTFLLGASSWRIEEITRDRVIVTPAPGVPGAVPFWKGDGARAPARARRGDRRVRPLGRRPGRRRRSSATTTSTSWRPRNLVDFLREQQAATRVVPSDRTIVDRALPRRDRRLAAVHPLPVRRPRARRLGPRAVRPDPRASTGSSPTRSGPTTGSSSTSPTPTSRPAPSSCWSTRTSSRTSSSASSAARALFGARFRENAGRALLIPRAYPGRRTPLWQQRLKSPVAARGRQALRAVPDRARDLPRVPARRARRPRPAGAAAQAALARAQRWSRSRRRPPRRSPPRCCSTTSRRTCTRATRRTRSAAPPRSRSTATCCASCSARRSCAS